MGSIAQHTGELAAAQVPYYNIFPTNRAISRMMRNVSEYYDHYSTNSDGIQDSAIYGSG